MRTHDRIIRRDGFTLIEVAIAMAVVVIGILAVFALITTGLDESGKAVAETNSALFADTVFNALGQRNQEAAKLGVLASGTVVWRQFWSQFSVAQTYVTVAAAPTWIVSGSVSGGRGVSPTLSPAVWGDGEIRINRYASVAQHAGGMGGIINSVFRYQLIVNPKFTGAGTTGLGLKNIANTNVTVQLLMWDGEFGSTNDPQEFDAEFDNPGDL